MELTFFGQVAFTVMLLAAMFGTFPLFITIADAVDDRIDSFMAVLGLFLLWIIVFIGIAFLVPMVWGAGYGGFLK